MINTIKTVGDLIQELQKHEANAPVICMAMADADNDNRRGAAMPVRSVCVASILDGNAKLVTVMLEATPSISIAHPTHDPVDHNQEPS